MELAKANAIAASAYNVCGPRSGEAAKPSNVATFAKPDVLRCLDLYADAHDGELFSKAEIAEARKLLA